MSHEESLRRIYELINADDMGGFSDFLADDFVEHEELPPGIERSKAGVLEFFSMNKAGFPDMRMDVEDLIGAGDKWVARVRLTGTNTGVFMGMPASGRSIDVQLIDIMVFGADGRVHEHWGVMDSMAMMQQLGAVPEGPPA